MPYFTKDFIKFFKDLAVNNNKEWFDANRQRYEASVKAPFKAFVEEMISRVRKDDKEVKIAAKDAIFRINRDTRFAKDKTPYKTHAGAIITAGGKKNKTRPGLYLQLGPEHIRIYSGAHMLDSDQLQRIREYIMIHLKEFNRLINDKAFKEKFGQIRGEKNKRLGKQFQSVAKEQPLIANKSFYYFAEFKPSILTNPDLPDILMDHYKAAYAMNKFFRKALAVEASKTA